MLKHGDLVQFNGNAGRQACAVVSVEGVLVLVDVIDFVNDFNSPDGDKCYTLNAFKSIIKRNHHLFVLVVCEAPANEAIFDELFGLAPDHAYFERKHGRPNAFDLYKNIA